MARGSVAAAFGEAMTAEETQLMEDNRAAEFEPQNEQEPTPAPEPAPVSEPAPVQAQQDEPPAQDVDSDDDADAPPAVDENGKQRKVDYGALHAERQKRKAAEAKATETAQQLATLAGRFQTIQELIQASQKPQAPAPQEEAPIVVPDVTEDPVGHFQAKQLIADRELAKTQKQLAEVNQWRQQQAEQAQTLNNVQRLTQLAVQHESEFLQREPTYHEAANYLKSMRDAELQAMGYRDPAQRAQIVQQDALQIAAQALANNMNAAEVVFNVAKSRGWAPKKAEPAPAAPAPVVAAQTPEAKKIATVAKGQQATQSLGQVNGSAVPEISAESIARMSDAEFAKWATAENWQALMGGS